MSIIAVAVLGLLVTLYAAFAVLLSRWWISMPMVFVAAGFVLGPLGTGTFTPSVHAEGVRELTEITLAILLFADASTLHSQQLRVDIHPPLRLLTIGLLLSIAFGTAVALGTLPTEGLALAALLGAILAPTDAALGLPVFNNTSVPVRIRRALNVESGLNDGIATPFVTLFLVFAAAEVTQAPSGWLGAAVIDIGLAALTGAAVGAGGGWLINAATQRGWTSAASQPISILGIGLTAYFAALALDANGFIAAFVSGLLFGAVTRYRFVERTEFSETLATVLSLLVWAIFGALLVTEAVQLTSDWRPILFAVLSLTLVRMIPVAVAMLGTGFRPDTILVMGWFGPRGLASVVFTLVAFVELEAAGKPIDTLVAAATWTILLSVVLHGLTAQPLSAWYARRLQRASGQPTELVELQELRGRHRALVSPPVEHN
jgi:sodium/hydrogen antiporter